MSSVARDVAAFLQAEGIGTFAATTGWSINVSREPVSPDTCVTIYDTGGDDPDTDEMDERANFQVRVRGFDYEDCITKARAIRDALIVPGSVTMNGHTYAYVFMSSGISSIGRDDSDRHLIVASYKTVLERSS